MLAVQTNTTAEEVEKCYGVTQDFVDQVKNVRQKSIKADCGGSLVEVPVKTPAEVPTAKPSSRSPSPKDGEKKKTRAGPSSSKKIKV